MVEKELTSSNPSGFQEGSNFSIFQRSMFGSSSHGFGLSCFPLCFFFCSRFTFSAFSTSILIFKNPVIALNKEKKVTSVCRSLRYPDSATCGAVAVSTRYTLDTGQIRHKPADTAVGENWDEKRRIRKDNWFAETRERDDGSMIMEEKEGTFSRTKIRVQ